jgi:hypothetical protein
VQGVRLHYRRLLFIAAAVVASSYLLDRTEHLVRMIGWMLLSGAGWASLAITWPRLVRVAGPTRGPDPVEPPLWLALITNDHPLQRVSSAMGWFGGSWILVGYGIWRAGLELFELAQRLRSG